jgi:hypothetical protein
MSSQRHRPILIAVIVLAIAWLVAWAGYSFAQSRRITADKVAKFLNSTDLKSLSGDARASALRRLAEQMNALPFEERRKARLDERWREWFEMMTDQEKADLIDATMPSGFKQMLASFENLPEDKRQKAIKDAIRDLKKSRDEMEAERGDSPFRLGTNGTPALSEELQQKIVTTGLKSFYSSASAQTKAEMAPLLEEMQRAMESGRLFRPHP